MNTIINAKTAIPDEPAGRYENTASITTVPPPIWSYSDA